MIDTQNLAALFSAMGDIPARLAALERAVTDNTDKLESLRAALPPALVTITEAATAFKVSVPTMRRWVNRGEVPTVKIGNTVRVDMARLHGTDRETIADKVAKLRSA
jgi:excisionase family DNA binding protein